MEFVTSPFFTAGRAAFVISALLVLFILWIAVRILFALAAYHDALSKENRDAVMWGLLIGFLGLIPSIIYLCVRNSVSTQVRCRNCGALYGSWYQFCPACGEKSNNPVPTFGPYAEVYERKAKRELTAGIVLAGVEVFLPVLWVMLFAVVRL
jgi:hypothetical protein